MTPYPKRLIEVDLPIKRISEHARREKDMRRGHVPLLHIWPATRPTAACRAVICASLWPDPADRICPETFRKVARDEMEKWTSHARQAMLSEESRIRFEQFRQKPSLLKDNTHLRFALLDFIADFSAWESSTNKDFLATSRSLTATSHEALGGSQGTKPLLVDPFSGGGAIPLEALRVGADAFASDLNPVAILIENTVLKYVPKFGEKLLTTLDREVQTISKHLKTQLADLYSSTPKATSTAYIWARTVQCEGPACGCKVPMIRSQLLVRRAGRFTGLQFKGRSKTGNLRVEVSQSKSPAAYKIGTSRRGGVTCPECGYTTPPASVKTQLTKQHGGASNATLLAVVEVRANAKGRFYRSPNDHDFQALARANKRFQELHRQTRNDLSMIPDERLNVMSGVFNAPIYGHSTWGSLFTPRQAVFLSTCASLISDTATRLQREESGDFANAVATCLALTFNKMADMNSALCGWQAHAEIPAHTFARWALPMVWDFAETNPLAESSGSPESALKRTLDGLAQLMKGQYSPGTVQQCSATSHPLPDDSASLFVTDPPYYNAVPYADLSDFFYVWDRRIFADQKGPFGKREAPKDAEICEMAGWDPVRYAHKDATWFETQMRKAMEEGRRVLAPDGLGLVVFAHKSTRGWEAQLQALIDAGWVVTASWPIDTEMASRMRAMNSAVLASSIHLVCRPRENADGSLRTHDVGDWRDVLAELPKRIHDWMPRLAEEGVVGADAIFSCLGPALEVFSRYARVEKPNGETVTLKEYLVHVWAAIAKEALTLIFSGADATGFEEDARLTAMWLWTLSTGGTGNGNGDDDGSESDDEDEESSSKGKKAGGYVLEYDAARKIAQGLGAHLEELTHTVEVMGETARLLPVSERTRYLFGKDEAEAPKRRKKRDDQMTLKGIEREVEEAAEEGGWGEKTAPKAGSTVLDRVHQSMILFAAGRGEAMKRFLVEEGIGNDQRFWKLAQAFSALYPPKSDEKRWVDGVLARKKGLGF